MEIFERDVGNKTFVFQKCNGVLVGDRLTDNHEPPDDYRFHDVFHLAHAAVLGWSPVTRALYKVKRKSTPNIDENQDGARAVLIEEGLTTWIFETAKEHQFFGNTRQLGFDLLKAVKGFVQGYEPQDLPMWLWERAILQGAFGGCSVSGAALLLLIWLSGNFGSSVCRSKLLEFGWVTHVSRRLMGSDPGQEGLHERLRKSRFVIATGAYASKFVGYLRTCSTPVCELLPDEHLWCLSIVHNVCQVGRAILFTMVRIFLNPLVSFRVPMINVVAVGLLQAST
jgi:hypothetical protein